jgi:hypothetical protein
MPPPPHSAPLASLKMPLHGLGNTTDLVGHILAGYAYHLNVMPLDAVMPDPGQLVRATDIVVRPGRPASPRCRPWFSMTAVSRSARSR